MPIKIPADLPGRAVLERENVPVITDDRAARQDIRPLQIALLNLMPDKVTTETQLMRLIGSTPLQIEMTLLRPASHESRNTAASHIENFYHTLDDVADRTFDGLIVTGAPVEQLPFEQVDYWPELQRAFNWAATNTYSTFNICWGAQAALHHYHDVPKHLLAAKHSGVYPHRVTDMNDPLTAGFDDRFRVPVSRNTEVRRDDIAHIPGLRVLADSHMTGLCLLHEPAKRRVYMFNHLEYDADTLKREYDRDVKAGLDPSVPYGYFPDDNPANAPTVTWRAHRTLLFHNWVNAVYQGTPYALADIPRVNAEPAGQRPRALCAPAP